MKQSVNNNRILFSRMATVFFLWLLLVGPAQAAEVAARVQFVVGKVFAIDDHGEVRRLSKGDELFEGDTLESGPRASAQLLFSDSSRMALRSNTILRVEDYHYDASNRSVSSSVFALLKGAVRSITGLIGKQDRRNVTLVTPVATIGIRGTDHETVHVTREFNSGQSTDLAGTYNKVYSGGTILRSGQGELLLDANQVGFVAGSPGDAEAPVLIDSLPREIDDLLVKKLPSPEGTDWARRIDGDGVLHNVLAEGSSVQGLVGDSVGGLAGRLESTTGSLVSTLNSTTESLMNSLDAGLDGDLAGALDNGLSTLSATLPVSTDLSGALSGGGISAPGGGAGDITTALPLSGGSLETITLPVKPELVTLPGL